MYRYIDKDIDRYRYKYRDIDIDRYRYKYVDIDIDRFRYIDIYIKLADVPKTVSLITCHPQPVASFFLQSTVNGW